MSRSERASLEGFLHAEDGRLVDGQGRPRLLRGVGLGGWLLPEGYMWRFGQQGPQSPRAIEAWVADLIGPADGERFWRRYRDLFIAEADIARIAALGFDHVRLALNARLLQDDTGALLDDGLGYVDRCIEWGRRHGVWVLLDLHGAPGGQTGTNIDDSPRGLPDLFLVGGAYRERTLALWRALAERYRDEPMVAGYDLLNEPLPHAYGERFADDLVALYRDLTAVIREVDPNHCIVYEGTRWATDPGIFGEVWDPNSMLQFHRYWAAPDRPGIEPWLELGVRLGLPVYMGEGGENDTDWLRMAFGSYEDLGIGWNLWPWKKLDTRTSPVSVRPPAGWDRLVAHAEGRGPRPSADEARETLDAFLEALPIAACDGRPEVVNAVLRRAPATFGATAFGFLGQGRSYGTDPGMARPMAAFRCDDAVTIRFAGGDQAREPAWDHQPGVERPSDDRLVVVVGDGEWVSYAMELDRTARVRVRVRGSWPSAAPPEVSIDGIGLTLQAVGDSSVVAGATSELIPTGERPIRVMAHAPDTTLISVDVSLG